MSAIAQPVSAEELFPDPPLLSKQGRPIADQEGRLRVSWQLKWVPLERLFVDYHEDFFNDSGSAAAMLAYQRKQARNGRVMASMDKQGYNEDLFGVLIGTLRGDGRVALGDGGTRYRFLMELNLPPETLVPVLINQWDERREVANYIDLNRERASLSQVDWFVAKVKLGEDREPEAAAINKILIEESGQGVGHRKGSWQAVSELQRSYRWNTLRDTVNLLRQLEWLDKPRGRSQGTIGGVSRLVRMRDKFDPERALATWADETPMGAHIAAKKYITAGQSRAVSAAVATHLGSLYNNKLRSRRLDLTSLISNPAHSDEDDDEGDE